MLALFVIWWDASFRSNLDGQKRYLISFAKYTLNKGDIQLKCILLRC